MPDEIIEYGTNSTMEKLIEENKTQKETIRILYDIVDAYDKELSNTTDMLKKTTNSLRKATKIMESGMSAEIRLQHPH